MKENSLKIKKGSRILSIFISAVLISTSLVAALSITENKNNIEILTYSYSLPTPKVITKTYENTEYTFIESAGSIGIGVLVEHQLYLFKLYLYYCHQ